MGTHNHLEAFVKKLVAEKGLNEKDEAVQKQIEEDLMTRVEDALDVAILNALPPDKLEEFRALVQEEDVDKMQAFCRTHIANMDELMAATLTQFRRSYLG